MNVNTACMYTEEKHRFVKPVILSHSTNVTKLCPQQRYVENRCHRSRLVCVCVCVLCNDAHWLCVIVSAHCREPAYRTISCGSEGEGLLGERWICERCSGLLTNRVSSWAFCILLSSFLHQRNIFRQLLCSPEKLYKRWSLKSLKFSRYVAEVPHKWKDGSQSMGHYQSGFRITQMFDFCLQ